MERFRVLMVEDNDADAVLINRELMRLSPQPEVDRPHGSGIAQHGMLEPGVAYLAKPFTTEAILRRVREVLAS